MFIFQTSDENLSPRRGFNLQKIESSRSTLCQVLKRRLALCVVAINEILILQRGASFVLSLCVQVCQPDTEGRILWWLADGVIFRVSNTRRLQSSPQLRHTFDAQSGRGQHGYLSGSYPAQMSGSQTRLPSTATATTGEKRLKLSSCVPS